MGKKKRKKRVSIVILAYNNLEYTKECLDAVVKTATQPYELVLVDNASTDGTVEFLRGFVAQDSGSRRVIENTSNRGFAGGCNQAVELARYEYICLLNNDTVPLVGWLDKMRACMQPGVGIVGAKLLFPDMTIQHAGISFSHAPGPFPRYMLGHRFVGKPRDFAAACQREDVPGVTAACLLTPRTVWDEVDGLDEGYVRAYFEDVDFNLKVRQRDYRVIYQPEAEIIHHEHVTLDALAGTDEDLGQHFEANYRRLNERWYGALAEGLAQA